MKHLVKLGATSRREYVFVQDSSVSTGAGKTGLAYNTASLVAYYVRPGGSATAITLATQTVTGSFSSGGFVEVDAANMPGVYRFDVPDAVFASGANKAVVLLKGAANMAPVALEYQLLDPAEGLAANVTQIDGVAAAAQKLALSAGSIEVGAAVTGTLSDTAMTTNLTETTADHYVGRVILWTSGALLRQGAEITAYDGSTKKLTYSQTTDAPSDGDTFLIV